MLRPYLDLPRPIHLLCLGTLINRAGTFIVPFLTLYLTTQLHYSVGLATTAVALLGVGAMVGTTLGGHLADQFGRKPVAVLALLGGGSMLLVLRLTSHPAAVLATIFMLAAIADMYRPASQALIADLTTPEQRPYAYTLVYLAINLGFPIGTLIGGAVAQHSWSWLFFGDAFSMAMFAMVIALTIPDRHAHAVAHASTPKREDPAVANAAPTPLNAVAAMRYISRDRAFMLLCGANLLVGLVYLQAMSTLPLYLDHIGIGAAAYGRIVGLNGVLIVAIQVFVTARTVRHNRSNVLSIAAIITGVGFGLHALAGNEWQFMLCVVVWTAGEMLQASVLSPLIASLAPAEMRARYMGLAMLSFSGANAIGAPLGGAVLEHGGGRWLWPGTLVIAWVASGVHLVVRRLLRSRSADVKTSFPVILSSVEP